MKVLVAGANGHTGRLVVEKLAKSTPHEAVALIRKEEQAADMKKLGATETIVADLEGDIIDVAEGMQAIIFAAGSGSKTGPDKTVTVDQNGAQKLVDSGKKHHIEHFVILSSMGADDPSGPIQHYLEAKANADEYLMSSGLDFTVVRPGGLSHDKATGKVDLQDKIEERQDRTISRGDVAHVMTASLDIKEAKNQVFEILSGDKEIVEALKELQ